MTKVELFIELAQRASKIVESDASWSTKYGFIFSEDISGKIKETGVEIDYYDPDTSYKEDVLAYVKALNEKADDLKKALNE